MAANTKKPKIMVENISCILPQESQLGALFLGNVYGAQNPTILKQYGVRAVLTSSIETDIEYNFKDVPFHMRISAHDKENYNIKQHINQCIQFIESSRQLTNVYVHCFAGVSRSAAIVCAYIMWKLKWNFETTIAFVKAKRIVANPNEGFVRQLMEIQNALLGIIDEGVGVGYQDSVAEQISNGYNSIKAAQVPLLLTQTLLKQTQNKQAYESLLNGVNNFNSTFPMSQFDRLLLQQHQNHQQPMINRLSTHDQQNSNSQYYVPTNPLNNHNIYQQNSYQNSSGDLYYVDPQKIAKSRSSKQKISVDTNFQKTASSDSSIHNNKFAYLQNFFPQNQTLKNQSQKPKTRINSTISSTINGVDMNGSHQKPGSVRKSLKKLQNTQVLNGTQIQKQPGVYYIPKTSSNLSNNNNHLILGGGKKPQTPLKSNYNLNSIPIPKIKQKSLSKNTSQYQNLNLTMGQQQFYHTLSSGYNNRNSTDSYSNEYSNRTYGVTGKNSVNINNTKDVVLMTSPRSGQPLNHMKYDQLHQKHNGLKSPTANDNLNHFSNHKFDFRNSAPSDGFFTNTKNSLQKNDPNKSSSRLAKPKDLPGYKNY